MRNARIFGRRFVSMALLAAALASGAAHARTAEFYSSFPVTPGPMTALSTQGDNAGQLVSLNQWMLLLFAQPFGVAKTDTVSIFTLPPPIGSAQITVSIGAYKNGKQVIADSQVINAGNSFTFNNLFKKGCSALGGCTFIRITTTRQRGGAPGAVVDYVNVNGEITDVTAPTPEPSVWALMILGFAGVAWRLKSQRRSSPSSANGVLARCNK